MLSKCIISALLLGATMVQLLGAEIVIKKGTKSEKVAPIKDSEVQRVSEKRAVKVGWEIDGSKKEKMSIHEQSKSENEGLGCH